MAANDTATWLSPATHACGARGIAVLSACFAVIALSSCASTQGLAPHSTLRDVNQLSASQTLAATGAATDGNWPDSDWWRALGDPQLDRLISEGLEGSPTLRVAEARTRAALAQVGTVNAARFPQVNAQAEALRFRVPQSVAPAPLGGSWNTLSLLQATLSWEIDLWGKNRAAYERALGEARASSLDAQAARLALSANIAHAYVQLERAYLELDVAQATLEQRQQIFKLTQDRNVAGVDSRLELRQAESALPAAREQIAQLEEVMQLTRNQIAALLGQGPDRGATLSRPAASALATVAIPNQVPSELLGRRPDILAQRWRVEAAAHGIQNAKAQFYPDVNLFALVGLQAIGPGLLSAASREVAAGPALSLPIFDAGRRRSNLAARDSEYDVAVEQYNQALADALREVVDQLVSFRSVEEQQLQQREGLATAQDAYDLATLRYREGVGNYLQVLTTETQLLTQRSLDADLRARSLDLYITLARALGGPVSDPQSPALVQAGSTD